MADVILTEGDDQYTVEKDAARTTIRALGGNDTVRFLAGSIVEGGAGNDTIIDETQWHNGGAGYWGSPAAIMVDLELGFALDGWGNRDTLVNIRSVWTPGRDGDHVNGSSGDDYVMLNGWGTDVIRPFFDGREGSDTANFWIGPYSDYTVEVAVDGRSATVSRQNYKATLHNVERLIFSDENKSVQQTLSVSDLIDYSKVGPATLLASSAHGWKTGQDKTITYSFMASAPDYGGLQAGQTFVPADAAYQLAVRTALKQLQAYIGLHFVEVLEQAGAYGQMRFGASQQSETKGYTWIPGSVSDERAGDVWMDLESLQRLAPGQEGWQALLHEIGHALGLSHPRTDADGTEGPVLLDKWNNNSQTVMSSKQLEAGMWQSWYGSLDLQALQALYGRPAVTLTSSNDVYRLSDTDGRVLRTLVDASGDDLIDLSDLSLGAYVDLVPGHASSAGLNETGVAAWSNLVLSQDSWIERVYDSPGDDVIIGNDRDNRFHWQYGNDVYEGAAGQDTVVVNAPRAAYDVAISPYSGKFQLTHLAGNRGNVVLDSIESIVFADAVVTLNTDGTTSTSDQLSAAQKLMLDRTAPEIRQVSPLNSQGRLPAGQTLNLSLSEDTVQLGPGEIRLIDLATDNVTAFSVSKGNLQLHGTTLTLGDASTLAQNGHYRLEVDPLALADLAGNPVKAAPSLEFKVGNLDALYQFFVVAFAAAPGKLYMEQLALASNAGLTVRQIVNIFTTKSQFTSVYPKDLEPPALARKLVDNIVKTSASAADKALAVGQITEALKAGLSVGDVIYNVFGNLASKSLQDKSWGQTGLQFQKQTEVARYLTEVMDYGSADLQPLQAVIGSVTPETDVSTPEKIAALIGVAIGAAG